MSSVRWGPSAVRQQPAGFSRAVVSEDGDVGEDGDGEDSDSDADFASGDSEYTWLSYTWPDVSVVTFITLTMGACENQFPLPGIMAKARRTGPLAPVGPLPRSSTDDRAERLGARLGVSDGADRHRARE